METYHDAIWRDACSQLLDVECNLRQAVNNLKKEIETLKNKLEKLEAEQRKLVLGQIAFLADEAILVYVVENPGYLYYHSDKEKKKN